MSSSVKKTVLLTGISGFIAKRIAYDLLAQGHTVRGTLRSLQREKEVRAALSELPDDALQRLEFVQVNLLNDDGWDDAMQGIDVLMHTASPFPLDPPKDEDSIIKPAVDGTLRALMAAQKSGVKRVILTASMETIQHGPTSSPLTEDDWSDPDAVSAVGYTRSKIFAEKAAWDFVAEHPEMQLTTIHPGLVAGTPLDKHTGSSVSIIARFLSGRDPMVPNIYMPIVDIEDVSSCHINAMTTPASIGNRYICAENYLALPEVTEILSHSYPNNKIATRVAPKFLVNFIALFDKQMALIKDLVDVEKSLSHAAATRDLGVDFISSKEAILKTAAFISQR